MTKPITEEFRAKRRALQLRWRKANPEKSQAARKRERDRRRQRMAEDEEYRKQQNAKDRARTREYNARHPQRHRDRVREYIRKNPDVRKQQNANRRAYKLEAFVERVYRSVLWKRDRGICYLCEKFNERKSNWVIEHKIPLSRGGQHSYLNTGVACHPCNQSKHNLTPLEFMRRKHAQRASLELR